MAEIVVGVSTGVMGVALKKLSNLITDNCTGLIGVSSGIQFLMDELPALNTHLAKLEDTDELDQQVKIFRDQAREMSYDIEDCIDEFMDNAGSADDRASIINRVPQFLKDLWTRVQTVWKIKELRGRLQQLDERRKRYKLDGAICRDTLVKIDPRLSAFYNEAANLVGIDGPKKELIEWVMDGVEELKVISVVGFGGLGKTTLANEVYREVGGLIDFKKAFMSVSQKPDIAMLLNKLLSQFGLCRPSSHAYEVKELIDIIRDFLLDKRYLVVIDDLWHVQAWDIIKYAFPTNDKKSRVIITTRQMDVAGVCFSQHGSIHRMKPLSDQDSKTLFFKRIFSQEESCPPQFMGISCEILKKCKGLPLAIITVAGILASQPTMMVEQWEDINNSFGTQSSTIAKLEDMNHILDLSYKFLPSHLKPCFLYLGAYPEDHEINRDDLVRKWVAEGFVSHTGRNRWDVAQSYFNELVNRNMIQLEERIYYYTLKKSYYKVHDMMLDLIVRRCEDNNFLSLVHDPQAIAKLRDNVRRLSIAFNGAEHDVTPMLISRKLLRSLAIFRTNCMPSLSNLRFLRLLFLHGFPEPSMRIIDLTCINELLQLRYLSVSSIGWWPNEPERSVVLPNTIRRMQHLETLEIDCFSVPTIPADIVDLLCLSHLIMPGSFVSRTSIGSTILPTGIGKAKMLHTLKCFTLPTGSSEIIKDLGELTNLEELSLRGERIPMTTTWMAAWSSSLQKLSNLRDLTVNSYSWSCCADSLSLLSRPFPMLEVLDVALWTFSRVPQWIGDLHKLRSLRFGIKEVSNFSWDDVGTLGKLPCLVKLYLRIEGNIPADGIVIGTETGFGVLVDFFLDIRSTNCLKFEAGAMPNLQKLDLVVQIEECDNNTTSIGLEHLLNLKEISFSRAVYDKDRTPSPVAEAKFRMFCPMFRDAVYALPGRPKFDDACYGTLVYSPWDEESSTGSSNPPSS